jgi:hypothetical protein
MERLPTKRSRGWIAPYAAAFVLVIASGVLLAVASLQKLDAGALALLRVSWWVSGAAIVLAILALVLPRRR